MDLTYLYSIAGCLHSRKALKKISSDTSLKIYMVVFWFLASTGTVVFLTEGKSSLKLLESYRQFAVENFQVWM